VIGIFGGHDCSFAFRVIRGWFGSCAGDISLRARGSGSSVREWETLLHFCLTRRYGGCYACGVDPIGWDLRCGVYRVGRVLL
jgi:hypothetical protein